MAENNAYSSTLWKVPSKVSTPNIEDDIRELLSDEILKKYQAYHGENENEIKGKIVRITEMLDLCNHLDNFSSFLSQQNHSIIENGIVRDNIVFNGHDYSGCPYDIEALKLYLYLSIIDACSSQAEHKTFDQYLINVALDIDKLKNGKETYLKDLYNEYSELYGDGRNFKKVFTKVISDELKKEFADNILVLSNEGKQQLTQSQVDKMYEKWLASPVDERIKRIAKIIYNVRNKYTHQNIRSFIPSAFWKPKNQNITRELSVLLHKYHLVSTDKNGNVYIKGTEDEQIKGVYIATINTDLFSLLKKVIVEYCDKMLSMGTTP